MVVSTTYDKDLKAKVFMVRDSERYTNSTQTSLEVTYTANYRSHMSLNLVANTSRGIGKSSIAFYDNDTLLGIVNCKQGDTDITLTADVSYGHHKVYAKYLGNMECLSSKSQIIELTVEEPNLPTPTLVFTPNNANQWVHSSTQIGGTVRLTGSNGVNNKTIKLYDGDTYITSATTNSSGIATFSNQRRSIGVHNWKFVFEGDDGYLAQDTTYNFACGYIITAKPYTTQIPRTLDVDIEVTVQVPDFNYTDGSDDVEATIILSDGSHTVDSSTFIGTDTLNTGSISASNKTFKVYDSNDSSNKVEIPLTTIDIGVVDVVSDTNIISAGISNIVTTTIKDTANHTVANVPLKLYIDEELYRQGITDDNGEFVVNYTGSAKGVTDIWAMCGDSLGSGDTIYDTIQYINISENISYNPNYTTQNNLSHIQKYNGLQLASNNLSEGHIYFTYPNSKNEEWVFEFKINSVVKDSRMQICGTTVQYELLKNKPAVKVEIRNGQKKVYVDGTLISTNSNSALFVPYLVIGANSEIVIDDIKLYRW